MKRGRERLLRGVVTVTFVVAGASKALDPAEFAFAIDRYRLLPWPGTVALALYLPWLEIFAALALWVSSLRTAARVVMMAMTLLFMIVLGSAWVRGLDIDCGCFGAAMATSLPWALARAIALFGALWLLGKWERPAAQDAS